MDKQTQTLGRSLELFRDRVATLSVGAPLNSTLLAQVVICAHAGLHTSITVHIAHDYLLDKKTRARGQNLELFKERVGNTDKAWTVENLYFAFLFFLRAVLKAAPLLEVADFDTGDDNSDDTTADLMRGLVSF